MNKIDLNGRCAVVTGGAQGFGRAITERFVASGAKVAIWDHDLPFAEKTARKSAPPSRPSGSTCSDLAAVEKTRDETLKALGKIDILVNNAGIAGINKPSAGNRPRRMAQGAAHQSRRPLHLLQGGGAGDARAEIRPHRQHRLDRRQGRQPQRRALLGLEGRPDRADQVARQGTRAARHPRQRGDAGSGEDRDLRPDDAAAHRLHAVEDSEGPLCPGRRTRDRWWRGWRRRIARSRPARCSTFPAAGRRTSQSEGRGDKEEKEKEREKKREGGENRGGRDGGGRKKRERKKRRSRQLCCRFRPPACGGRDPDAGEDRHDAANESSSEAVRPAVPRRPATR